ncbi:uncharacterized protein Z520_06156 [Fonsecaea multimorphosa CBS 102226]|uniref:3-phytase n=1 Tax=Fonsecaea multimorphosa CBS 102226 TaxID=1442371 RepID=A0A0D2IM33_9EURO|nr:uncharacterized protein Z520_06156 [Fonsecaea multimorphosa CBS 102226]KIX98076.1 hypothetical protein Z520_06156 [Fonsecaea multimorphosa CBS 102226]OAL24160.1 hypothetical protein AYO22_05819 [Fonsecaea multimorphosa]
MRSTTFKLTRDRGSRRLYRQKLVLFILILFAALLAFPLLRHVQNDTCSASPFLLRAGLCSTAFHALWNLLHHLGGNGPWIRKIDSVNYYDSPLPKKCSIDQVHMLSRHAERYPTKSAGFRHVDLLGRLQGSGVNLTGSLSFLKEWTYFTDLSNPAFENLTATGPYAGTRQAANTGRILRQRYNHLVADGRRTNFWSCSSPRDVETAEHFANGFFGPDWKSDGSAELVIIPEDEDRGANTLTPGDTCLNYRDDKVHGHDHGYAKLAEWQSTFSQAIAERLANDAEGMIFKPLEIYGMMEMCGFEILARGKSPWCDVFEQHEWLEFEYARDLLHYYRAGPGNKFGAVLGWLWLNATQQLMSNHSSKDVYFSFVHDGDIIPALATLGIFNEPLELSHLPTDRLLTERKWKTSDVVPMGGRLIFERITCATNGDITTSGREHAVRLFINDGLVDLAKLTDMVPFSQVEGAVSLESFQNTLSAKGTQLGDFREICALPDDAPDRIDFLHQ